MPRYSFLTMCKELAAQKTLLRREMRKLRDGIPQAERKEKSKIIAQKVLHLAAELDARTVFAYLSFGSEVETHDLIRELLSRHIRVAVPLCDTKDHTMQAVHLADFSDLKVGAYGILEPDSTAEVILPEELNLILVPALAFDEKGYRLGYGGGFYDRYLQHCTCQTAGLAFEACVLPDLIHDVHDLAVGRVITEEG